MTVTVTFLTDFFLQSRPAVRTYVLVCYNCVAAEKCMHVYVNYVICKRSGGGRRRYINTYVIVEEEMEEDDFFESHSKGRPTQKTDPSFIFASPKGPAQPCSLWKQFRARAPPPSAPRKGGGGEEGRESK